VGCPWPEWAEVRICNDKETCGRMKCDFQEHPPLFRDEALVRVSSMLVLGEKGDFEAGI
jgi:hypothetical protein